MTRQPEPSLFFPLGRLIVVLSLITMSCGRTGSDFVISGDYLYANHDPAVGYVGPEPCKKCHPDKYDTYIHSEMGRSFKKATLSNSAADFENASPVYDPYRDFYYFPFSRDEDLFMMEYRIDGADTVHKRVERIDYIVGSGQHTNSHIMDVNGYLFQMPLTWYVQDRKWDLPPGFGGGGSKRFDRPIEVECLSCHNAQPDYVAGSGNRYNSVPLGIDCERCHGPGEIHVKAVESGRVVNVQEETDYTIVHPGKLPAELQFDICQRCHLQGTAVTTEGRTFLDFRPGMKLSEIVNVFQPRYSDSLDQFIMASHPDRLRMSECFRGSARNDSLKQMTCVTCHNPHIGIEATSDQIYQDACLSCHASDHARPCSEDSTVRVAVGDNCASCHMPVSGSKDIPHVRITDHFIRRPDKLTPSQLDEQKTFVKLASLTNLDPLPHEIAEGYLAHYEQYEHRKFFLDSAEVYLQRAVDDSLSTRELVRPLVRLWFLKGEYERVISIAEQIVPDSLDDAWTLYRIGESYSKQGDLRSSIRFYERSVEAAPYHLEFRVKLATTLTADRQLDRAIRLFDDVLADDPKNADALNNRGFAYVLMGDFVRAEEDFDAALALNPDSEQALANMASLYANTDRRPEARKYLQRLIEMNPSNPNYRKLLSVL